MGTRQRVRDNPETQATLGTRQRVRDNPETQATLGTRQRARIKKAQHNLFF